MLGLEPSLLGSVQLQEQPFLFSHVGSPDVINHHLTTSHWLVASLCQCVTSYICEPPVSRDHYAAHINGRNYMILQISICHTQKSMQLHRV
jgi:hypothetical protein